MIQSSANFPGEPNSGGSDQPSMSGERNLRCVERDGKDEEMLESAVKDGQKCLQKFPVIVLGSGASIPEGLPSMEKLANHLKGSELNRQMSNEERNSWNQFIVKLDEMKDLESALQTIQLSEKLSNHVAAQTWNLINKADTDTFENILNGTKYLPLARLYQYLFNSTKRTVSVVTTNYDRLAEYAADCANYCHYTGFSYGYLRQRQQHGSRLSFKQGNQAARTVEIWKVHGCLDWFIDQNSRIFALVSPRSIPSNWRPAIVTPGIKKYESTHNEPFRSIINEADNVLENANAYLCVGFGFNDMHIQPKLLERWTQGNAFLVILAKTLKEGTKRMLEKANNSEFLALEKAKDRNGTYMRSHKHPQGVLLKGVHLWKFSNFLEQTIGGD